MSYVPPQPPQGQPYMQYPTQPVSGSGTSQRVIKKVGVGSAAKVAAMVSALVWSVFGLLLVLLSICGGGIVSGAFGNRGAQVFAGGLVSSIIIYVVGFIIYGIIGGIVGALYAAMYNLTARWIGGLEVEVG